MQGSPTEGMRQLVPNYFINDEKQLGKGCYGYVYEGYSKVKNRKIAVKVINQKKFKSEQDRQLLQRQIDALKELTYLNHPNIMGYEGFVKIDGKYYLFLQFCPGGDLEKFLKKDGDGIDEELALKLFKSILDGMSYMNAHKIMHRDLAPKNILVCDINNQKILKISDFGLARNKKDNNEDYQANNIGQEDYQFVNLTTGRGTPLYQAPQIKGDDQYTQNCDVWSAGLILFQLLNGIYFQYKVKNPKQLKKFWQDSKKGGLIELSKKRVIHPYWDYFYSIMMVHNKLKRENFLSLHKKLNLIEKQMLKEIIQNRDKPDDQKYKNLQRPEIVKKVIQYLTYVEQKLKIIFNLYELLKQNSASDLMHQCVSQYLGVLAFSRYLAVIKAINKQITAKTLSLPGNQKLSPQQKQLPDITILFEKHFRKFQNLQIQKEDKLIKVVQSLDSQSKKDSETFSQIPKRHLFTEIKKKSQPTETEITTAFKLLVKNPNLIGDKYKDIKINQSEAKIYLAIFLVYHLEKILPEERYFDQKYVKTILEQYKSLSYEKIIETVKHLSNDL